MIKRPQPLTIVTHQDNMVLVKGGVFDMGSEVYDSEQPVHKVQLNDFYIGKSQVTQALWEEVMKYNPADFPHPQRPVERVSWYDCVAFCNELSKKQGLRPAYTIDKDRKDSGNKNKSDDEKRTVTLIEDANGYRLPTEAEWEYAVRGGHVSKRHQGVKYAGSPNHRDVAWSPDTSHTITQPCGLRAPNPLGLFDMSGNVLEWCWDWYGESYYKDLAKQAITERPIGPESGSRRVVRGGSWVDFSYDFLRVAYRFYSFSPSGNSFGLRLCRYP